MITLAKVAASMLSASAVGLGAAYVASVPAGAVAVGVFLLGWLNGVGDTILT